jgi:tetratricopeptide (TPR) repeat protein
MVTRIFLCNERSEPDIRTFIREAMEDIANGERYIITWSCGSVQTVKVGDRAYFKRIGSAVQGYFACGQVVAADREYQLRLKASRYRELSEAYDVDMYNNCFRVWVAWDSCVDFDHPLRSDQLRQLPQFQGMPLEPQAEAGVFREEYVRLLDWEWDRHSYRMAREGKGLRLVDVYYRWALEDVDDEAWEEAINSFTQAIRLRPNFVKAYMGRGEVYLLLKRYPEAIADFGQVISLQPTKAKEAYYKRGLANFKQGQYEQALADLQEAIALDPQYLEALLALANSYFKLKSYEQAIANYSQVINLDPSFGNAFYRRGRCYFVLKEFANSLKDFTEAIALNPELADAYYYRALTHSELRQTADALADLQQAMALYRQQGKTEKLERAKQFQETLELSEPVPANLPAKEILQIPEVASSANRPPEVQVVEKEKLVVLNIGERSPSEKTALVAVTSYYAQEGWEVRPVSKADCGYDLHCRKGDRQEEVLIKHIEHPEQPFCITASEMEAARYQPNLVLWVVSVNGANGDPVCQRWSGAEILQKFELQPVEFVAKVKSEEITDTSAA